MPNSILPGHTRAADARVLPGKALNWRSLGGAALLAAAVLVSVISIRLTWVGFIESDDTLYANAAMGWLNQHPFLGDSHWSLRHCIVLPMAALFLLFGRSETTLVLPSLTYCAGFLALLAAMAWRMHSWRAAALAILIAGTVPVIATSASFVSTDVPEAFFVVASVFAFYRGIEARRPALMFASGCLAGVAMITRETSVALCVLYAVLFALGYGGDRRVYLLVGLGAATIVGLDTLYLASLSGDPLYRLHIAQQGARWARDELVTHAGGMDSFGVLDLPLALRPLAATFVNQNFGLLFWLAAPAAWWLARRGPPRSRSAATIIAALALTWFVVVGYALLPWLWVIPRYYAVSAVLAAPLAVFLALQAERHPVAIAAVVALVVGSGLALDTATTNRTIGEHALLDLARRTGEPIRTDPATQRGAEWLLDAAGVGASVSAGQPAPGALYFFNSQPRRSLPADWPIQAPPPSWTLVETVAIPPKWTHVLVHGLGLESVLPAAVVRKLDPAPHLVALYRAPPG